MAYLLEQARPEQIAEREWAVGQKIKFGKFTSCVGVVARITGRDEVIGIHLSLFDASDEPFDKPAVDQIIELLDQQHYDETSVHIIGFTSIWGNEGSCGDASAAYKKLINAWEGPVPYERDLEDGTLAVSILNGRMTFTYEFEKRRVEKFYFPEQQQEEGSALDPLAAPLAAPVVPAIWHPGLRWSRSF